MIDSVADGDQFIDLFLVLSEDNGRPDPLQ